MYGIHTILLVHYFFLNKYRCKTHDCKKLQLISLFIQHSANGFNDEHASFIFHFNSTVLTLILLCYTFCCSFLITILIFCSTQYFMQCVDYQLFTNAFSTELFCNGFSIAFWSLFYYRSFFTCHQYGQNVRSSIQQVLSGRSFYDHTRIFCFCGNAFQKNS